MKWYLVFVLWFTVGGQRTVLPKEEISFTTEQECRDEMQEILRDPASTKQMFTPEYIIIPQCIELTAAEVKK